MRQPEEELMGR